MRKFLLMAIAVFSVLPQHTVARTSAGLSKLTVMSFNIRTGEANDGTNSWQFRYPSTALMIYDQRPDVIGLQEAMLYQLQFIDEFCKGYSFVGVGRDDGRKKGEHVAIVYNKKTVSVVKWGTFWLSDTPEKPTVGWDAECERTATWALMKTKTSGKLFYFVSTHLDNKGSLSRKNSLDLILSRMRAINKGGHPVVVAGDFNMPVSDPAFSDFAGAMKNARRIAADTDDKGSYHGWGKENATIDHIFYSGFRSCTEFRTVTDSYGDRRFISSHYPVKAVLVF